MSLSLPILREKVSIAASSSLPRVRYWLFFFIIFFSSTQLGLHYWPNTAIIYGVRIDYLSPTFYFLDILLLCYLFLSYLTKKILFPSYFYLITTILLINLLFSVNSLATLSWSFHFLLYLLFFFTLTKSNLDSLVRPLILTVIFQSTLGIIQVFHGSSLQGIFYFLGERRIDVGQPAVATGTFFDQVILRAYGTFGHPNVLAGFLALSLYLLALLISNAPFTGIIVFLLGSLGVLFTLSRSAYISLFLITYPLFILGRVKLRVKYVLNIIMFVLLLFLSRAQFRPTALTERLALTTLSAQILNHLPLFGSGANASLSLYPILIPNNRLLQPDHNTLTLAFSWLGLVGSLAVLILGIKYFQSHPLSPIYLLPLLPLLLLDHYLLTSPQGLFLLLLTLKVVHYKSCSKSSSTILSPK